MTPDPLHGAHRILVVEDDLAFQSAIAAALPQEMLVSCASNSSEARRLLESQEFDLILLDLTLPDGDGMRLCSWIRADNRFKDVAIMLITGHAETDYKVMAFSLGANDYMVKPIDSRELRARVLSHLKRARGRSDAEAVFFRGNLKFVVSSQQVFIIGEEIPRRIETSSLEFRLLLLFAQNEERVFSRDELISRVWGEQVSVLERTVDSHVSDLRKKLISASHAIQAVRGAGYRLVPLIASAGHPRRAA